MLADRWNRIAELFERALDLPAPERGEWLTRTITGDDDLLTTVRRMLDEHDQVERSRFLVGAPRDPSASEPRAAIDLRPSNLRSSSSSE